MKGGTGQKEKKIFPLVMYLFHEEEQRQQFKGAFNERSLKEQWPGGTSVSPTERNCFRFTAANELQCLTTSLRRADLLRKTEHPQSSIWDTRLLSPNYKRKENSPTYDFNFQFP